MEFCLILLTIYYYFVIIIILKGRFYEKFLKKMPVMIVFVALAVIGLLVYIPMLARPVSYGMTYVERYTATAEDAAIYGIEEGTEMTARMRFDDDKSVKMLIKTDGLEIEMEMWIYRNGNKFTTVGMKSAAGQVTADCMTEDEYNTQVEEIEALKDTEEWDSMWNSDYTVSINAFRTGEEGDYMLCEDAIIFTVLWGVLEVALIVFASLSVVFFVKGKKTASETTEEQTSNETIVE